MRRNATSAVEGRSKAPHARSIEDSRLRAAIQATRRRLLFEPSADQFPNSPNNYASALNYVSLKQRELIGGQSAGDDQPHARIGDIPDYAVTHAGPLLKFGRSIHNLSMGRAPFLEH
jgi:hypothetical protein